VYEEQQKKGSAPAELSTVSQQATTPTIATEANEVNEEADTEGEIQTGAASLLQEWQESKYTEEYTEADENEDENEHEDDDEDEYSESLSLMQQEPKKKKKKQKCNWDVQEGVNVPGVRLAPMRA